MRAAALTLLALVAAAPAAAQEPGRIAMGAFIPDATERPVLIDRYARMTGRRPAIVLYYRKWGDRTFDHLTLRRVARRGAIPLVTWEPWDQPLHEIAAGDHDEYIRAAAREARAWGHTILLRFAHEMNGDWYPWGTRFNSGRDFVRAWRHVVRVFRRAGARNVRWAWTPNVDYGGYRNFARFFPGDRWIDWAGVSGFSWGGPWEWESASKIFDSSFEQLRTLTAKPLMIAEIAAGEKGGNKAAWIDRTFRRDLVRLRGLRAVVWFNGRDKWAHWDVDSSRRALRAFRAATAAPLYGAGRKSVASVGRPMWCCADGRSAAGWGR